MELLSNQALEGRLRGTAGSTLTLTLAKESCTSSCNAEGRTIPTCSSNTSSPPSISSPVVGAAPVPPQAVLASLSTRQVSASSSASETGSRNGNSSGGNAGPNSNSSSSSSTGRTQNVSLTSTAGVSQTSPVASRSSQFPSRRSSDAAVTEIKIERRELPKPAVQTTQLQLPDGRTASYLRVNYISSAGTREVQRAVSNSATNGSAGFIIDLRNNPGESFSAKELPFSNSVYFAPYNMCFQTPWLSHILRNQLFCASASVSGILCVVRHPTSVCMLCQWS